MTIPEGIEYPLMHQDKVLVRINLLRPLGRVKRADANFGKKFTPFVPIIGEITLIISAPS